MFVLDEMMDDPRNAARSPRSNIVRTIAALVCAVALLVAFAFGVKYIADNWRELIYGKTAAITVVNPEDGAPTFSNEPARSRGGIAWTRVDNAA